MTDERRAPMQGTCIKGRWIHHPGTISWDEHLEAYAVYAPKYGSSQSAERIAERGGFGYEEFELLTGHEPKTWMKQE